MAIDTIWVIDRLESNAFVFQGLLRMVKNEQAVWKPKPDKWSILEVINHLVDEESEDFRTRLRLVLEDPEKDWPPIDPERAAVERQYNARDLQQSLDGFVRERKKSIEWLKSLPRVDWQSAHIHPKAGALKAGDLLTSWLAHDMIHIRQINNLHHDYLARITPEFSSAYAGNW